jgi:GT2 family glycosyltransferase
MADRHRGQAASPRAPAVCVVIPVGDVDGLLSRQVAAVLAQRAPFDFEVVLSLNTPAAAARAAIAQVVGAAADGRLRVVVAGDRRGAAHARNVGARASAAPLLAFCDADDEVRPGWLAALVAGLRDWDAVSGHVNELAPAGQQHWRPPATPGRLPTFLGAPYVLSGNLGIARRAFADVGGFDETLSRCEDIALGWSLLRRGYRLGYVSGAVLDYRHRSGLGALLRQHYWYGRGMAEVVSRYPLPAPEGHRRLRGLALVRPNAQAAPFSVPYLLRRASLATGRVVGLLVERRRAAAQPAAHRDPGAR